MRHLTSIGEETIMDWISKYQWTSERKLLKWQKKLIQFWKNLDNLPFLYLTWKYERQTLKMTYVYIHVCISPHHNCKKNTYGNKTCTTLQYSFPILFWYLDTAVCPHKHTRGDTYWIDTIPGDRQLISPCVACIGVLVKIIQV